MNNLFLKGVKLMKSVTSAPRCWLVAQAHFGDDDVCDGGSQGRTSNKVYTYEDPCKDSNRQRFLYVRKANEDDNV